MHAPNPRSPLQTLLNLGRRAGDASLAVKYFWSRPNVLLVLGMHRSGTSCVTRILGLMGAELGAVRGDEEVMAGEEAHWENPNINWINDSLLERNHGSWDRPFEVQPMRRDLWRCRRAMWEFGGSRIAAIKDPRIVITYPLWRRVLPQHTVIACLRHPMSVARSLTARDGFSESQGLQLWYFYNRLLLRRVAESSSVFWFDYDEGAAGAGRLIQQLASAFTLVATSEALAHFNPAQRHHRDRTHMTGDIGRLYEHLRGLAHQPSVFSETRSCA